MSDPDQPPPSEPRLEDFRRKPRVEPGQRDDTPSERSGGGSGFLSGCASFLLILLGIVLLLPGICFVSLARNTGDAIAPLLVMGGLLAIGGGIAIAVGRRGPPRKST